MDLYDPKKYIFVLSETCFLRTLHACLAKIALIELDENDEKRFTKYVERHSNKLPDKYGNTSVQVHYATKTFEHQSVGRMYPTISSDGINPEAHVDRRCDVFSTMCRKLKSIICTLYHDIDFKNSHYSILLQLLEKNNIECDSLKIYNNDRDNILKKLAKYYKTDTDNVKTLFIEILYGGGNNWKKEFNIIAIEDNDFVQKFKIDIKTATTELLKRKKFQRYIRYANYQDKTNPASAIFYLLATAENDCLVHLYHHFTDIGYTIGSFEYDGMRILKKDKKQFPKEHIESGQKYIFEKTGFNIILTEKITTPFLELPTNNVYYVSGNSAAAEIVINNMKDSIIYSSVDSNIYYKNDNKWNLLKKYNDFDIFVDNYIFVMTNGNKKTVLTDDIIMIEKISKAIILKIKKDKSLKKNFQLLVRDTTKGKICFNNGVYDFKTKEFTTWDKVKNIYTETIMDRNYNPNINNDKKEYIFNFFEEQFGKESFKDVLKITTRSIAGHTEDKRWITLFGNRNSGKGLWEYMLRAAFEIGYIATTNSENFVLKKGSTDAAKDRYWMVPIRHARLVVTNEISPNAILNGPLIKNFCSSGDMITGRELYCNSISFYHQCTFMICCNDIAKVEPIDTNDNRIVIDMPYSYVSQSIIDESNEYKKRTLKLSIPNIKEILTRDSEYVDAFISIIFDYYEDSTPKIIVLDEVGKTFSDIAYNIKDKLLERFIIDRKGSDFMTNKEISKILEEIKAEYRINESIPRLKKILKDEGAEEKTLSTGRGLKYIKPMF